MAIDVESVVSETLNGGPEVMLSGRPRSPVLPAELVMRLGPLQTSAQSRATQPRSVENQTLNEEPRWGQSRCIFGPCCFKACSSKQLT